MTNALILLLSFASADVGPAPSCPAGTYSQYCMGRRCVPDGKVLNDKCEEVDGPKPLEPGPAPEPAKPEPAKPAAEPATPAEKPEQKGCATSSGAASGLLALAGVMTLRRRRSR